VQVAFQISTISILQTYLEDSLNTLAFTKDSPNKQASQVRACRDFIVSVSCLSLVGFDSTWRLKLPRRMKLPINSTRPGARSCHLFQPGARSCHQIGQAHEAATYFKPAHEAATKSARRKKLPLISNRRTKLPTNRPGARSCHLFSNRRTKLPTNSNRPGV
jgi:hypothetical protein